MPDDSQFLVLGTAHGFRVPQVWVFVESLRRYYQGPAMLLVSGRESAELVKYLHSRDVTPVFFDCADWMTAHVQLTRYVRYGELLRGCQRSYERILLSDVADVLFQAHPLAGAPRGELLCFMERPGQTIGECPNDSLWVRQIFGADVLKQLSDRPISCSGTTIGSHAAILRYIDFLLSHADPKRMAGLSNYRGHDQGIHNYLLHTGALPEAQRRGEWRARLHLGCGAAGRSCVGPGGHPTDSEQSPLPDRASVQLPAAVVVHTCRPSTR